MRPIKRRSFRARAADRRPPKPHWWAAATALGACFTGVAAVIGVSLFAWKLGAPQEFAGLAKDWFDRASASRGLRIEAIVVNGLDSVSRHDVVDALALDKGAPILAVETEDARRRVEALAWVVQARVERQLPDVLVIEVVESRPIARHARDGEIYGVDDRGEIVRVRDQAPLARLPVVVGDDAPGRAPALFGALATEPSLARRVRRADLMRGRRWDVMVDGRVRVRLPERGVAEAWSRLAAFDAREGLLARAVVAIDLRHDGFIAVELDDALGEI